MIAQTTLFTYETWSPKRREAQNTRTDGQPAVRTLASPSSSPNSWNETHDVLHEQYVGGDAIGHIVLQLLDELDEPSIDRLLAVFGPGPASMSSVTLPPWSSLLVPATVVRSPEVAEADIAACGATRSRSGSFGVEVRVEVDARVPSESPHRAPLTDHLEQLSPVTSTSGEINRVASRSPFPSLVKSRVVSVEEDDALFDVTRPRPSEASNSRASNFSTLVAPRAAPRSPPSALSSVVVVNEPLAFEEVRARSALEQQEFNLRCALTRFERGERGVWLYLERAV